jgi:hypothetical protein
MELINTEELMPDNETGQQNQYVRIALQPDGLFHLVTGRDWLRSFCGLRLTRYELRYTRLYRYGSDAKDCRQCAAVLEPAG